MNNKSKVKNKIDLLLKGITCNCDFCNQIKTLSIGKIQEKLSITDDEVEKPRIQELKKSVKSKLLCKNTEKYIAELLSLKRRKLKSRTDAKTKRNKEKQEEKTLEAEILQMQEEIQKYPKQEDIDAEIYFFDSQCQIFQHYYGPIV
jgi:hypothetical protein